MPGQDPALTAPVSETERDAFWQDIGRPEPSPVSIRYGLDIKTPTTVPGDDGWKPVLRNRETRIEFDGVEDLFTYWDKLKATHPGIQLRVVKIESPYGGRVTVYT